LNSHLKSSAIISKTTVLHASDCLKVHSPKGREKKAGEQECISLCQWATSHNYYYFDYHQLSPLCSDVWQPCPSALPVGAIELEYASAAAF